MKQCPIKEWLTTKEAAAYLGQPPEVLVRCRKAGGGPISHRHGGRVLYRTTDLVYFEWMGGFMWTRK
jgi:Helix-turn-helix domain